MTTLTPGGKAVCPSLIRSVNLRDGFAFKLQSTIDFIFTDSPVRAVFLFELSNFSYTKHYKPALYINLMVVGSCLNILLKLKTFAWLTVTQFNPSSVLSPEAPILTILKN